MKLNEKIASTYYTAAEAKKILGLNDDTFQGWVKAEKVKKIVLPGRKQGVYVKREIDLLAASIDAAVLMQQTMNTTFKKAKPDLQEDEFKLAVLNFGEKTNQFHEYRKELLRKNPDMSYYLYDGNFLTASINFTPLDHEGIMKFKDGERGWLLGDHVERFTSGKPLECIIIDMMTTTLAPANKRTIYGELLLLNLLTVFEKWLEQDIEIGSIYACGGTPDGERILKKAQFTYLGESRPNRRIYELIIADTTTPLFRPYKSLLEEYKRRRGE